jgi:hypothetical protein
MQDPPHGRFKRSRTPVQTPSSRRTKPTPGGQRTATPGGRTSEFRTGSPALQASLPAPHSVDVGTLFTEKAYKFSEGFLQFFGCVNFVFVSIFTHVKLSGKNLQTNFD